MNYPHPLVCSTRYTGRRSNSSRSLTCNPAMATSLSSLLSLPYSNHRLLPQTKVRYVTIRRTSTVEAFRRSDFDVFAKRITSGGMWKDAWRTANDSFEQLLYETKKTAERIDREYSFSRRLSAVAQSAADRAREFDREFELTHRWRNFALDFSRNLPKYKKQLDDFLKTPLGRGFAAVFFLWFALSGWLFRFLIIGTWVLPFAGPLLIGAFANNLIIKGTCPSCKRQFIGNKTQTVRCAGCRNIVWQPQFDLFSGGNKGGPRSSNSGPDIIDVEFEEK